MTAMRAKLMTLVGKVTALVVVMSLSCCHSRWIVQQPFCNIDGHNAGQSRKQLNYFIITHQIYLFSTFLNV